MIKPFTTYVAEGRGKTAAITFGRFNPPTVGHEKLINAVAKQKADEYFIFASHSSDPKKNPLNYEAKIKYMRKMFPRHARSIVHTKDVNNMLQAATYVYNAGFQNLTIVVGQDRVNEFERLVRQYNGKDLRHGFYEFAQIKIVSAGARDPDAEGVEGMSASKMRQAAVDNDFLAFQSGLPRTFKDAAAVFSELRASMGINETSRRHIKLPQISETRERYVAGEIFNVGDVVLKEERKLTVVKKKPNYVICKDGLGRLSKEWIENIK
jgi:phosphopantetheine adenylyltransferase